MLRIRLTRVGKKNSPSYRVVVADRRRAVKRKFIEIIGHYNPTLNPKEIVINKERAIFWMGNGAQPSDTVNNLMCNLGILDKKELVNKVYGKKLTKKAIKAGPAPEKPVAVEAPTEEVKEEEPVVEAATEPEVAPEAVETVVEPTEVAEEPVVEEAIEEKTEEAPVKETTEEVKSK